MAGHVPLVAGQGFASDEFDKRRASEVIGERPGLGLVDPHQRRLEHQSALHTEIQGDLQGLDGVVPAVRISVRCIGRRDRPCRDYAESNAPPCEAEQRIA